MRHQIFVSLLQWNVVFLPVESNWAELREEQRKALELPNTAMAVGIDLGEWNDIHPLNKKDLDELIEKVFNKSELMARAA